MGLVKGPASSKPILESSPVPSGKMDGCSLSNSFNRMASTQSASLGCCYFIDWTCWHPSVALLRAVPSTLLPPLFVLRTAQMMLQS